MELQQTTTIPEVKNTIVMLRQLSADEQVRREAYNNEKRLHDEASALGNERRKGRAEGRAEGRTEGRVEERVASIKNIMEITNGDVNVAMDWLKIPENEREKYRALLKPQEE